MFGTVKVYVDRNTRVQSLAVQLAVVDPLPIDKLQLNTIESPYTVAYDVLLAIKVISPARVSVPVPVSYTHLDVYKRQHKL